MQFTICRHSYGATHPILLYLSTAVFSRDTETTDFLLLVSYVIPCASRRGVLPRVHLSDDSGSGIALADDIAEYLHTHKTPLSADDYSDLAAYLCDVVSGHHDHDLPNAPARLILGSPYPYRR